MATTDGVEEVCQVWRLEHHDAMDIDADSLLTDEFAI